MLHLLSTAFNKQVMDKAIADTMPKAQAGTDKKIADLEQRHGSVLQERSENAALKLSFKHGPARTSHSVKSISNLKQSTEARYDALKAELEQLEASQARISTLKAAFNENEQTEASRISAADLLKRIEAKRVQLRMSADALVRTLCECTAQRSASAS